MPQNIPPAFRGYLREQRRVTRGAVAETRRLWRGMGDDFDASWNQIGPAILTVTTATQRQMGELAGEFIPDFVDQVSTRPMPAAVGTVNANALVGVAGDGRSAQGLLRGAVTTTKEAVGAGSTTRQARMAGLAW